MSPEDVALCQQAIELANSGQTQAAYEQFCALHNRGNPEDVTLLYWIAATTPRLVEAQRARDTIAHIEPDHPKLPSLQDFIAQKKERGPNQIQCPNCGKYNPERWMSYENPRTGRYESADGPSGCLIYFVAFFAIGIVVELVVGILLYITGKYNNPLYGDVGLVCYPIAFYSAFITIPLYRAWWRSRLRRTRSTVTHCMCTYCKKEWVVEQEPTAKKLS